MFILLIVGRLCFAVGIELVVAAFMAILWAQAT